ncbi:MAG: hypothetical protein RJAPGHWK_000363 [Candidatus Fervidibacter sp.]
MRTVPISDRQRRRRWEKGRRVLIALGLCLTLAISCFAGVSLYLHRQGKRTPVEHLAETVANWVVPADYAFAGRDRLNILVVGADRDYDNRGRPLPKPARSDTILVISLNRDGSGAILSIPRDTIIRYNGKLHKINAVHAIGGPQELQKVLAEEFGIETHHFVQVTFDAFVKLVDLVGGVDLFVEYDMHYDDNWGNLHIHLQRGFHHLNGKEAIGYVRYRGKGYRRFCPKCKVKIEHWDPTGDIGRVQRQQKFLRALAKKLLQPSMVAKLPQLAAIAHEYLATDMDTRTMLSLANFARQVNLDDIKTATLPGLFARHPRLGSILIPDREKTPQVLADLLGTTFLVAQWEQGAGDVSRLLKVAARPRADHPTRSHRRRTPHPEATPTEDLEANSSEGVPLNHEPVEVVPLPSEGVIAPPPPVQPEAPTEPAKPAPPEKSSNAPSSPPSPSAPSSNPSTPPPSPQGAPSEQPSKR